MATKKTKPKTALVLRCCNSDMSSKNGFVWPGVGGIAIAADWKDDGECGSGLHGWLYGQGDHQTSDYWSYPDAKWLVVEVEFSEIRMLGGKCKFQSGRVVFVGEKSEAAEYIVTNETYASDVAVIGHIKQGGEMALVSVGALGTATAGDSGTATAGYSGTATAGDSGTATAGDRGTATAGDSGTATAGDRGMATAGDRGMATAGYSGTATAGDSGMATAGYSGTATAGYSGTATAGYSGTATAGDRGIATAGDRGMATAGYSGTATAGYSGTATAGDKGTATAGALGTICIKYWDLKNDRYRTVIGYIGEDGIKQDIAYKLDANHKFIKVTPEL
jgi:hypothetical protein